MAESVDALVSNTSGFTSIPVRPRVWVLKRRKFKTFSFFYVLILSMLQVYRNFRLFDNEILILPFPTEQHGRNIFFLSVIFYCINIISIKKIGNSFYKSRMTIVALIRKSCLSSRMCLKNKILFNQ